MGQIVVLLLEKGTNCKSAPSGTRLEKYIAKQEKTIAKAESKISRIESSVIGTIKGQAKKIRT